MKKAMFFAITLCLFNSNVFAQKRSICGKDDRELSTNPKVARVLKKGARAGCTLTMISKSCAVSAGHCTSTFEMAEFNTPVSKDGKIQHPSASDVYMVDKNSIKYLNGGMGKDWAVLRLNANEVTGQFAGDVQGFYPVAKEAPVLGDTIRITGYGADYNEPNKNFAQQTHIGPIVTLRDSLMQHRADTMGGNSGSSVINDSTGEVVGIHTHGGCSSSGGQNSSTLLSQREDFKQAIAECLESEKNE